MTEKMTRKEMFELIAATMADNAEVVAMCEKYIEQLSKPRKKKENYEAIEFAAGVATWLSEHEGTFTNKELAAAFEVSSQKMSAALKRLVAEGTVNRIEPEKASGTATFELA